MLYLICNEPLTSEYLKNKANPTHYLSWYYYFDPALNLFRAQKIRKAGNYLFADDSDVCHPYSIDHSLSVFKFGHEKYVGWHTQ